MTDPLRQPTEQIEALQSERLRELLGLCARGHRYYKRTWAAAGVDIASIQTIAELERLPLTFKADLMAEPESFRLNVAGLPLAERTLWDVIYTTGTTSEPTPVYNTTHDYHAYLFQSRRVAEISGIRESDVIANLFPLTPAPMGAFVRSAANAYASGAAIFAVLPGAPHGRFDVQRSLDEGLGLVERHRATVLWGVPSFVRRTLLRAGELSADWTSLRMCVISGETSTPAIATSSAMHARRRRPRHHRLRSLRIDGAGCIRAMRRGRRLAQPGPGDPVPRGRGSADRPPAARRPARMLAVTHLDRRGTVLLRYVVGDEVALTRAPCPACGEPRSA